MVLLATTIVDTSALWKIVVAALVGGAGVVVAFGILLIGLDRAGRAPSSGARLANYALSGLAGLYCLGAVVIGIYAMAKKPASPPTTKSKSAQLDIGRQPTKLLSAATQSRAIAS